MNCKNSQFQTKEKESTPMSRSNAIALTVVLVLLIGLGIIIVGIPGSNSAQPNAAPPRPQATSSAPASKPAAVAKPTEAPGAQDPLAAKVHDPFVDRALDYEQAYQYRYTPMEDAMLASFGTPQYLGDHKASAADPQAEKMANMVFWINRDLQKTTVVAPPPTAADPNTRFVSVTAVMSSGRRDSTGKITPVETNFNVPIHSTTWKLVNGVWLVDQER